MGRRISASDIGRLADDDREVSEAGPDAGVTPIFLVLFVEYFCIFVSKNRLTPPRLGLTPEGRYSFRRIC